MVDIGSKILVLKYCLVGEWQLYGLCSTGLVQDCRSYIIQCELYYITYYRVYNILYIIQCINIYHRVYNIHMSAAVEERARATRTLPVLVPIFGRRPQYND